RVREDRCVTCRAPPSGLRRTHAYGQDKRCRAGRPIPIPDTLASLAPYASHQETALFLDSNASIALCKLNQLNKVYLYSSWLRIKRKSHLKIRQLKNDYSPFRNHGKANTLWNL